MGFGSVIVQIISTSDGPESWPATALRAKAGLRVKAEAPVRPGALETMDVTRAFSAAADATLGAGSPVRLGNAVVVRVAVEGSAAQRETAAGVVVVAIGEATPTSAAWAVIQVAAVEMAAKTSAVCPPAARPIKGPSLAQVKTVWAATPEKPGCQGLISAMWSTISTWVLAETKALWA